MSKSWELLGSCDGPDWVLLDRCTSEAARMNGESRAYLAGNTRPFRQYRILVHEPKAMGVVRIANVALFAPKEMFGKATDSRCRIMP